MTDVAKLRIAVESGQVTTADKRLDHLTRTSVKTERATGGMTKGFKSLASTGILPAVGAAVAFGTAMKTVKEILRATSVYETLRAQLRTATGSVQDAAMAFEQLQTFAQTTPFIMNEVVESFVRLKNLGLDPSIATLTSYGNTASAMGKSLNQFIEAVADATVGEFERLKEFGIKANKQGEEVSFTFRGIRKTIEFESGKIEDYLRQIGDVEFAGAMDERAGDLSVSFSNLTAATDRLLVAFGEGTGLVGTIKTATNSLADLLNMLAGAPKEVSDLVTKIVEIEGVMQGASKYTEEWQRSLDSLHKELAKVMELQEGPSNMEKQLEAVNDEIAKTEALLSKASGGEGLMGALTGLFTVDTGKEKRKLDILLEARERMSFMLHDLEIEAVNASIDAETAARAKARDKRIGLEEEAATKRAEVSAKDFERLKVSLLSDEDALVHSYNQRLEIIRANTEEGTAVRKDLEDKAREQLREGLEKSNDLIANAEDQKLELLRERYISRGENLRAQLEIGLIDEQTFQDQSKANWDAYMTYISELGATVASSMRAQQLEMYSDVLGLAGKISGQLSDLAGESGDAAKAMFVAQKAISIAQAIVYTELAATRALAEGGMVAGIPMASIIRGMGYASVAIMTAQAAQDYAGKFEHGGMIPSGKVGMVGEAGAELVRGPAMVSSARSTASRSSNQQEAAKPTTVFQINMPGATMEAVNEVRKMVGQLHASIEPRSLAAVQRSFGSTPSFLGPR